MTSQSRFAAAQKSAKGAPPYSLYINRPLGRRFAIAADRAGMSPNQVTYLSALVTLAGLVLLAVAPAGWLTGVGVSVALALAYALDSADGQLARVQGRSSLFGEWLDHMIDSVKVVALHVAVLISMYRNFDLPAGWLFLPLLFAISSSSHFFGMILMDHLARLRRAQVGLPPPPRQPENRLKTLLKMPIDYGVLCLSFLTLGAHLVFLTLYGLMAVAMFGYTVLVVGKWRKDVAALDALTDRSASA